MEINQITGETVDAALKVHTVLGPGLLENAYEVCLTHELRRRQLHVVTQVPVPVHFEGLQVELGYRIDMLVEDVVLIELKAISKLLPVHEAQLLSYLKLSGRRVGLLINFHVLHLKDGIRRLANGL